MDLTMAMRIVFAANIPVAGLAGLPLLLASAGSASRVLGGSVSVTPSLRIVGACWVAIAVVSIAGVFRPSPFAAVLLIQLLYKGGWLIAVALPAIARHRTEDVPMHIAAFFLVWCAVLPFVIPWRTLFAA